MPVRTSVPCLAKRSFISAVFRTFDQLGVQLRDRVARHAGGPDHALERAGLEAGQALLGDRRRIRRASARAARSRSRAPAACRPAPCGQVASMPLKSTSRLAARRPRRPRRSRLCTGCRSSCTPGALRELDAGELRRAADAGDGEVELAGIRLGERDQLLHVLRLHRRDAPRARAANTTPSPPA